MVLSPRLLQNALLVLAIAALFVLFIASPASAQKTHQVKVGGEVSGTVFTEGVVWFNGYDPGTIVIHPGDTVVWTDIGGVHTVTSTVRNADGSFAYDSSPSYTPEIALADLGPGMLLGPGSVYELDTNTLAPGTYTYACKIHPGMTGTLVVTTGIVTRPVVTVVAGFGDSVFAQQAFVPANLTVPRGTIVQWHLLNPTEPHTITHTPATGAPAWDSSPNFIIPPGPPPFLVPVPGLNTFSRTFPQEGTYAYFCKVHAYKVGDSWAGMVGTVLVVPPSVSPDTIGTATLTSVAAFATAAVAIAVAVAVGAMKRPK